MSATANHDNHAPSEKKVTLNGLIIIGFFGLVIAGMLLAVYASRYVPDTLARLSAAVYLTSDPAKNTGKATTTPTTTKPQTPSVTPSVPKTPTVSATSTTGTPQLPNETGYTPRTYTPTYTQPRCIPSAMTIP
jgi:hypothetical protein